MTKQNAIKAVKVTWIDAEADNSWTELSKLTDPKECHTLGYLVKETENFIYVSSTMTEMNGGEIHVNNTLTIPKAWVKSMVEIKEPRQKK